MSLFPTHITHIGPHAANTRVLLPAFGALGVSATGPLVPLIVPFLGSVSLLPLVVPVPLALIFPTLSGILRLVTGLTPLGIFWGLGLPLLSVLGHGLLFFLVLEELSSGFSISVDPVLSSYCSAYAV